MSPIETGLENLASTNTS